MSATWADCLAAAIGAANLAGATWEQVEGAMDEAMAVYTWGTAEDSAEPGGVPDTGQPVPAKDEETDWAEVVREEDLAAALDAVNHGGHGIRWSAVAEVLGAEVERLREEGE